MPSAPPGIIESLTAAAALRSNLFGLSGMEVNFVQLSASHGKVNPKRWTGIDHAHG
jgi:hypothetical protein